MAKNDNIQDLLHDVAEAIRNKKGTTDLINPQDFSNEIRSIESGGTEVEEKDVNFYDYDGTLLFSYTIPDAQALTELPTPKGHSGLIFDGWNWDYEDVIALDCPMNIGALYITDDGATRLYLEVKEPTKINFHCTNEGQLTINFGDGRVETTTAATVDIEHTYSVGSYVMRLNGTSIYHLKGDQDTNILGEQNSKASDLVTRVELGTNAVVNVYCFAKFRNMETFCAPIRTGAYNLGSSGSFYGCSKLRHVNFTKSSNGISYLAFVRCFSLQNITLPKKKCTLNYTNMSRSNIRSLRIYSSTNISLTDADVLEEFIVPKDTTSLPQGMFSNCFRLRKITLHDALSTIGASIFSNCWALQDIVIPNSITELTNLMFYRCYSLRYLKFSSLIKIGSRVFEDCSSLRCVDMSENKVVPTLSSSDAFTKVSSATKIVVPDALYDEWIAATNWSTYADRIVKASENQPNNE